ncbi:hypothetical protein L226DRAFT_239196 [Lentinus tigrinus ALCF2SS1-7]|uniref:uncharacterized protein n=1 Tax=Lentinus tigrinus ALCF2SS1-7 TaxID=1328758 RepID=UPI001165DD8E|nr:hypothetical protein L226DRAFT_239196 [Lentinus tigrinus ALCF2SS1-7]
MDHPVSASANIVRQRGHKEHSNSAHRYWRSAGTIQIQIAFIDIHWQAAHEQVERDEDIHCNLTVVSGFPESQSVPCVEAGPISPFIGRVGIYALSWVPRSVRLKRSWLAWLGSRTSSPLRRQFVNSLAVAIS